MSPEGEMIPVDLERIVLHERSSTQYIYLAPTGSTDWVPIVIGRFEADEIHRVVLGSETQRPLTHQLAFTAIQELGGDLVRVDIVDLRENTFYAELILDDGAGTQSSVDARPSDAIALALRARCPIRVSREVMEKAGTPKPGFDPDSPAAPPEAGPGPSGGEPDPGPPDLGPGDLDPGGPKGELE